ncbi:MAG: NAD(P)(+) transhydrogenase (Re/Si-specific) subunit alpha [Dehalococcoidia bacterium]|nr:NAD(P)(+) transhydrogenase (Re/Si-specific) subunit alpha [Dehalococcoidia bacterium]
MADNIVLGIKKEDDPSENRVSIVPKDIKSIINLGVSVQVEENSGIKAGYTDDQYESSGAKIVKKLSKEVNIITAVNAFYNKESNFIQNSSVISLTDIRTDQNISKICTKNSLSLLAMEFVPRIARAQKLDALSSQASIAGYRAGLLAATSLKKYLPLMMTAAGTIPPSSILVLGAGVAGLQAIATAKRLGAEVTGYDIRLAAGEQIESLGAKFISDEVPEDSETSGGYAKEQSKDKQTSQLEFLKEYILKSDAVISTAAIPGRKAPILIEKNTVEQMKAGSVIVDISAPSGGNCESTILGESVNINGTIVHGPKNLSSEMAYDASLVYSKNIYGLLEIIIKDSKIEMDLEDEIIDAMLVFQNGKKRIEG